MVSGMCLKILRKNTCDIVDGQWMTELREGFCLSVRSVPSRSGNPQSGHSVNIRGTEKRPSRHGHSCHCLSPTVPPRIPFLTLLLLAPLIYTLSHCLWVNPSLKSRSDRRKKKTLTVFVGIIPSQSSMSRFNTGRAFSCMAFTTRRSSW